MLEALPRSDYKGPIYRLAGPRDVHKAAQKRGLDPEELADLLMALGPGFASDFLDTPFQPFDLDGVPTFGDVTRFSDGSFPVFYASETAETSEAEVRYHRERIAIANAERRLPVRLCVFHCQLDAKVVDLRPMRDEEAWKGLRSAETQNPMCLALGKEACGAGSAPDPQAFLTPSARCDGTTTPTFTREVLSNAVVDRVVRFVFDQVTGQLTAVQPA